MKELSSKIQRTILSNCSFFKDGAKYSDLRVSNVENDLFNYHLQQLVKNKFLVKKDKRYFLTIRGKSTVTNIDEVDINIPTKYKVSVYLCPVIDGKLLLFRRKKHPQYGYSGVVSGKIGYGESSLEAVKREFEEETNLNANFKLIGLLRQIRKNKSGNVIEDGHFYVFYTDKVKGTLRKKSVEGTYFWKELDRVDKVKKVFKPSVSIIASEISDRLSGKISWDLKFIYELEPEPEAY